MHHTMRRATHASPLRTNGYRPALRVLGFVWPTSLGRHVVGTLDGRVHSAFSSHASDRQFAKRFPTIADCARFAQKRGARGDARAYTGCPSVHPLLEMRNYMRPDTMWNRQKLEPGFLDLSLNIGRNRRQLRPWQTSLSAKSCTAFRCSLKLRWQFSIVVEGSYSSVAGLLWHAPRHNTQTLIEE